jgi:hypothetical protein
VREAEAAGKSVQSSLDGLIAKLASRNMNLGIGTKNVFDNVFEARARDGARVYFRNNDNGIEILGKSSKANQERVINRLRICMTTDVFVKNIVFLHLPKSVEEDNVDAVIYLSNGIRLPVTFFTIKNILKIMSDYETTGECLSGKYFWSKDMIIVNDLSKDNIARVVDDLVRSGDYVHALQAYDF